MEPTVIKSEKQYEKTLKEIERLMEFDPKPSTPEGKKLELLSTLAEIYEKERFPFDVPDAVEAIKFRMEEEGLKQKDLISIIGSKSKVSEVLSRKRPLTLSMIRSLATELNIPPEILLREQDFKKAYAG